MFVYGLMFYIMFNTFIYMVFIKKAYVYITKTKPSILIVLKPVFLPVICYELMTFQVSYWCLLF